MHQARLHAARCDIKLFVRQFRWANGWVFICIWCLLIAWVASASIVENHTVQNLFWMCTLFDLHFFVSFHFSSFSIRQIPHFFCVRVFCVCVFVVAFGAFVGSVGGSIKTYQSYNSLATSMAISEAHSQLSVLTTETAPPPTTTTTKTAHNEDDSSGGETDVKSDRSSEMTHLWVHKECEWRGHCDLWWTERIRNGHKMKIAK